MRAIYTLTQDNPYIIINDPGFHADGIAVINPTASAVYMRVGGTDRPSATNYNFIIPAASNLAIPTTGTLFALAFSDPTSVGSGSGIITGLGAVCEILVIANEPLPSFGSFNYTNLSISNLTTPTNVVALPATVGPFDLGNWGGLIAECISNADPIRCNVVYETSADLVTWYEAYRVPLWPRQSVSLTFPRYLRYARIRLLTPVSGIGGTANFTVLTRASLTEVIQLGVSSNNLPSIAVNLGAGTSTSLDLDAPNLNAFEFLWLSSSTPAGPCLIEIYGSADGITFPPLPLASESLNSSVVTVTRIIGYPPPYLRIKVINGASSGTMTGSLIYKPIFIDVSPNRNYSNPVYLFDRPITLDVNNVFAIGAGATVQIGSTNANNLLLKGTFTVDAPTRVQFGIGVVGILVSIFNRHMQEKLEYGFDFSPYMYNVLQNVNFYVFSTAAVNVCADIRTTGFTHS